MALFTWDNKYSVGIKAMDAQHITLVETLNQLHEAMLKGELKSSTGPLLKKLVKYTKEHFAAEETMLKSAQYPSFAQHHAKHDDLTRQVEDFVQRFEKGEITLNIQLMNFLRDWLANHIQKEDKEYGAWLNKKGIA